MTTLAAEAVEQPQHASSRRNPRTVLLEWFFLFRSECQVLHGLLRGGRRDSALHASVFHQRAAECCRLLAAWYAGYKAAVLRGHFSRARGQLREARRRLRARRRGLAPRGEEAGRADGATATAPAPVAAPLTTTSAVAAPVSSSRARALRRMRLKDAKKTSSQSGQPQEAATSAAASAPAAIARARAGKRRRAPNVSAARAPKRVAASAASAAVVVGKSISPSELALRRRVLQPGRALAGAAQHDARRAGADRRRVAPALSHVRLR